MQLWLAGAAWAPCRVSWLPAGLSCADQHRARPTGGDRDTSCRCLKDVSAFGSGLSTASPEQVQWSYEWGRTSTHGGLLTLSLNGPEVSIGLTANFLLMCLILLLVAACLEKPIIILVMVRLSFPYSLVAAWCGLYSHGNNQYLPSLATVKLHWLF